MLIEEVTPKLLKITDTLIENIEDEAISRETLDELVKTLLDDDVYLSEFANKLSPKELSVIYISRNLINELWGNLATDASFGMEFFKDSQHFKNFKLNLSYYIKLSLEDQDNEAITKLYDAISSYFKLVVELMQLGEKEI
ncbi:MAG: hypothetical protein K8R25_11830 [Methanosarcinales archaeon]|nr:hypothetical protein [Methanosarcinales archaeon]